MTKEIIYPDMETAITEMAVFLSDDGQELQLRGNDKIDNILGRIQQFADYNSQADIAHLCAVLIETVVQTHIFVDGNKRFALMLAYTFLGLNDLILDMKELGKNSAHQLIVDVVEKKITIDQAAEIIRANVTRD